MKKLILITSIITAIFSSAFAKTEGNLLGVDVLRSSARSDYNFTEYHTRTADYKDSKTGLGINYKYAFNFNGIFVAPGVFFDYIGAEMQDYKGDTVSTKYRYGAKFDIGYDVTDNFSAYFTNGVANNAYKVDWKSWDQKTSSMEAGYFYGAGLSYKVTQNVALNFEYNIAKSLDYKTPYDPDMKGEAELKVAKLGISYNF